MRPGFADQYFTYTDKSCNENVPAQIKFIFFLSLTITDSVIAVFSEITRKIFLRNIAHISKWNLNIKKLRFQTVCCDFLLFYLEITKMAFLTYGCIWIYLSLDIFIHNSEIFYIILRYSTYTPPNTEYTFSKTTRHI